MAMKASEKHHLCTGWPTTKDMTRPWPAQLLDSRRSSCFGVSGLHRAAGRQAPRFGSTCVHVEVGGEAFGHLNHLLQFRMSYDDHPVTDESGAPVTTGRPNREQVHSHDVLSLFRQPQVSPVDVGDPTDPFSAF